MENCEFSEFCAKALKERDANIDNNTKDFKIVFTLILSAVFPDLFTSVFRFLQWTLLIIHIKIEFREKVRVTVMESATNFEDIDLADFLGEQASDASSGIQQGELFTERQHKLLNEILPMIQKINKEKYEIFINRIADLESMANSVAKFPSLLGRSELAGGTRTRDTLIESLIKHQDDTDRTLRLPSKLQDYFP